MPKMKEEHDKYEPVFSFQDLDNLKDFMKDIILNAGPGPFLPKPELDMPFFDKLKGNFVTSFYDGFLINKDGQLIGVKPLPNIHSIVDMLDVGKMDSHKYFMYMNNHLGWLRYHAELWEWYDRKPLGRIGDELDEWLDDIPQSPKHVLP